MPPSSPSSSRSALQNLWLQWKSLRFPWRRRFLVGLDLQGNTYYEFRLARGDQLPAAGSKTTTHFRRMVHYPRSTELSEVRVPPAWHQWLRYQREHPPTAGEQAAEAQRQARIKVLAAEADARWEAKGSLLDMPPGVNTQNTGNKKIEGEASREVRIQGIDGERTRGGAQVDTRSRQDESASATNPAPKQSSKTTSQDDPWKRASRGGPSEAWQPEAWTPTSTKNR